ncbi:unnamed protein product, partial [Urochloa humidicola]
ILLQNVVDVFLVYAFVVTRVVTRRRGSGGPARGSTGGSPASRRASARSGRQAGRRVASGLSARDSDSAAAAGLRTWLRPRMRRSISGSADWRAGLLLPTRRPPRPPRRVEEDGGGGVQNFRGEAPDHPRPTN